LFDNGNGNGLSIDTAHSLTTRKPTDLLQWQTESIQQTNNDISTLKKPQAKYINNEQYQ